MSMSRNNRNHPHQNSARVMELLADIEKDNKKGAATRKKARAEERKERQRAAEERTKKDSVQKTPLDLPSQRPFNRRPEILLERLSVDTNDPPPTPPEAAHVILQGPIWIQIVHAFENPFTTEIKDEIIPPETITLEVKRRSSVNGSRRRKHLATNFSFTMTVENISHHRGDTRFLIISGHTVNVNSGKNSMRLEPGDELTLFYRLDSRSGAILTQSKPSATGPLTKYYVVPEDIGY